MMKRTKRSGKAASVMAVSGTECRWFTPINRVEMTPSRVELVLLSQAKGESTRVTELINSFTGDNVLIQSLKRDHCAAPDGSPSDEDSRFHERQRRGNRTLLYPTPHTPSLD